MFGFKKKPPVYVLVAVDSELVMTVERALDEAEIRIGRDDDAHIVLAGPLSSRAHAAIVRDGERFVLNDVGSRNGTFVNGERIESSYALSDGDEIGFGKSAPDMIFREKNRTAIAKAALRYDARQNVFFYGDSKIATVGEQTILLKLLFDNRGHLCDRKMIVKHIWRRDWDKFRDDDALDKMSSRVRNALRAASPQAANLLVTRRGQGYELRHE
jgi:DNA-binding response OmpR family regulator